MKTKLRITEHGEHYIVEQLTDSGWKLATDFMFMDYGMAECFVHCLINRTNKFELI